MVIQTYSHHALALDLHLRLAVRVLYLVVSHITHPVLYGRMFCRFFYCRLPCRLAFVMVFFRSSASWLPVSWECERLIPVPGDPSCAQKRAQLMARKSTAGSFCPNCDAWRCKEGGVSTQG